MNGLELVTKILNKKILEEKIMTQKELANKMGVAPVSVNQWLKGGRIDIERIPDLCSVLEISPNELFDFNTGITEDDLKILKAYKNHPEYQDAIKRILGIN